MNNQHRPYQSVLVVKVPASTIWKPVVAEQFMISLFAIPESCRLIIHAKERTISWYITIPNRFEQCVFNSIYALYPSAEVFVVSPPTIPNQNWTFHFDMADSFVLPLKHARDFTGIDPIAPIVAALGNLNTGEEAVYELFLSPAGKKIYKLGKQLISRPRHKWHDLLFFDGAMAAAYDKVTGTDRVARFIPELQKLAQGKMATLLKEAKLRIRIVASSSRRANDIAGSLIPALAPFGREGSNYLIPANKESFPLILMPQEAAALWHLPSESCRSPGVIWSASVQAPMPTLIRDGFSGVVIGKNIYQGRSESVSVPYNDRETHINMIGKTRTGKSTLMHNMIHQDIAQNKGVGIIDPHGKLANDILANSIPQYRERDIVLSDINDVDYPVGINLLQAPSNVPLETVASQALSVVRKMFTDSWSSTRMEDALYAALVALVHSEGSSVQDVHRLFVDSGFRTQILSRMSDPVALEFWYDEYEPASAPFQREIARPISNRIRKFYRNRKIRNVIGQSRSLNFRDIIDGKKIFVANLCGLSDVEAEILGALLISKFQVAAMSRGASSLVVPTDFYLYIDEVQSFITTSLPTAYSESSKYGLRLVTANQYMGQLDSRTLGAIMGNVGSTIIFRVGARDANALAPLCSRILVHANW